MFHAIADSVFDPALSSAGDTPAARETAQMYLHAASILEDWDDPLQPWLKYQVLDATSTPYPFNIKIDDIPQSELLDLRTPSPSIASRKLPPNRTRSGIRSGQPKAVLSLAVRSNQSAAPIHFSEWPGNGANP